MTLDTAAIARRTARGLLDIGAISFNAVEPFTHASGKRAPTYIDCRRIISFPEVRSRMMDDLAAVIRDHYGDALDNVAGGETAGISFAAFIAERLALPMTYVRKKPKGYGKNARIEGQMAEGARVLLVEDLTTDGGSKLSFVEAIRDAGGVCDATAVVFFYDIYPDTRDRLADHGLALLQLCTWWDVLEEARSAGDFDAGTLDAVETFLRDPAGWQATHS